MTLYRIPLLVKVLLWSLVRAPVSLASSISTTSTTIAKIAFIFSWDFYLFAFNCIFPKFAKGKVIQKSTLPGYGGLWPTFVAPLSTDSRSPCPGLNALANHGILPHDGRDIKLSELAVIIHDTYNFAETLCAATVAQVEQKWGKDTIDLSDLNVHNVIAHDASLLRKDAYFAEDQSIPDKELISKLLATALGAPSAEHPAGYLTPADCSRFLGVRRAQSKRDNPVYTFPEENQGFGFDNTSVLLEIYGGDVESCQTLLIEERIPQGWESWNRTRKGFTIIDLKLRSKELALGMTVPKL